MAVYTVANGGGNINAGATYVGGIAPSSTDTIDFTATSGQLTVNTNFTIAGIDFTNYVNTLTMSAILSVKGNVTLVAGMTIAGASRLSINATSTITSNGKTWPNAVDFNMTAGSQTVTVADDWNITGTVSFLTNIATFNGNKISVGGSLTNNTNGGTTLFELVGTGTWTSSGFKNSLTINTAGTITVSGTVSYSTGTLTYIAGTVTTTGSTLSVTAASTLDISGINLNNITFGGTITVTLLSDLNCTGTLTIGGGISTFNNNNINVGGSLVMNSSSIGTSQINLNGTGSWSGVYPVKNNLTIKSTAIIDIVGSVQFNTGTFIVEAGAQVNASNSTLSVIANATTTFDISTIKLNNFYLGGASTVNTLVLNSPLYITGTAYLGASSQNQTINGSPVYIESGTLSSQAGNGGNILGTSQIIMTGDKATYLDSATPVFNGQGTWRIPITINVRGTILMYGRLVISTGGSFNIQNGTVDHRDGLVNRTSLIIQANTTLTNIDKCKFKNITINNGLTVTMNKFFTGSPNYKSIIRSNAAANYTITFTNTVPKKAFHVNIKNATITNRNQLNVINRDGNAGNNLGIIFGEIGRNGYPINKFPIEPNYPFGDGFLTSMNN